MNTVECPYCEVENHVESCDCSHDGPNQMECEKCEKNFVFYAEISVDYNAQKADCLNGSPHAFSDWRKLWDEGGKQLHCRNCRDCGKQDRASTRI
jgi:hypothetical protein